MNLWVLLCLIQIFSLESCSMATEKDIQIKAFNQIAEWTLMDEVPFPSNMTPQLANGEKPIKAFKTFRDSVAFTSHRIMIQDIQGFTGKRISMYSIPYWTINMWSIQTVGVADINAEVELWTREGHFMFKLGRSIDVQKVDVLLASRILRYS